MTIEYFPGLYHNLKFQNIPNLVIGFHCGIFDEEYTSSWQPSLQLLSQRGTPTCIFFTACNLLVVLTVADETELFKTTSLLEQWNVPIKISKPNKFASQLVQQLPDNRNAPFCTNKFVIGI
jgi:hypothetical protein